MDDMLAAFRFEFGWRLYAKDSSCLGEYDWLAVAGSGVAHPRWSKAFGGPPPLVAAVEAEPDAKLKESLEALAGIDSNPVTTTLM
eukprot:scaffold677743_cov57-Prasinocladus_malaysianus.AAC.1